MAAPAAPQSVAVVAQVPQEPAVPVQGRLGRPVLAELLLWSAVLVQRLVPVDALLAERPVPAHWVLAALVDPLLSRQSFSAEMAGTTALTQGTYGPVPGSR